MPERASLPEHVTMPLLEVITRNSLDQDYQHVAEARAAAGTTPERPKQPRRRAALVATVFGLLIVTAAVQTSREADTVERTREQLIDKIGVRSDQLRAQQRQIRELREETEALDADLTDLIRVERSAARDTLELGGVTGFAAVRGEGVRIVVDNSPDGDSKGVVRDEDLATLVDGLWAAGAEAIAINGQRITQLSGIRLTGSAINIRKRAIRPPYTVLAIGNTDTLQANFVSTSSGALWVGLARSFDFEFDMRNADSLSLPAGDRPQLRSAERLVPRTQKEEAKP